MEDEQRSQLVTKLIEESPSGSSNGQKEEKASIELEGKEKWN